MVARLLWEQKVVGSNPATPTIKIMIPTIGDLLRDWLVEQNSEWRHRNDIKWKSNSGETGSAHSETGFIVHPLSQNLAEVLWVSDETVSNPMMLTEPLLIADPKFFDKLAIVLSKMPETLKQDPHGNKTTQNSIWVLDQSIIPWNADINHDKRTDTTTPAP